LTATNFSRNVKEFAPIFFFFCIVIYPSETDYWRCRLWRGGV